MRDDRLLDTLNRFAGKCVLVVGDIMLDEYIWGEVHRVSPEAPVLVVEVRGHSSRPGGAANAATNVVSLGGRALLGGIVGRDAQAATLREALTQAGVDADGVMVDEHRPTTTKTRVVASSQHVVRMDLEIRAPLPTEIEHALFRWASARLAEADACVLSDYDKGVVSPRLAGGFIQLAREAGKPIIVDPKGTRYGKYRGATVVTPNLHEAQRALNWETHGDADLLEIGRRLLELVGDGGLLITRGAQGMSLFLNGTAPRHVPAVARNALDVTGAGDTVVATLAMALAAGATLEQAARLANRAAGIVVGKFGTSSVTIEELLSDGEA